MPRRVVAMLSWVRSPRRREEGQALAEYSLILALIAVACIIALGALGLAVSGLLDDVTGAMP